LTTAAVLLGATAKFFSILVSISVSIRHESSFVGNFRRSYC
jgi:hypothetical protein